MPARSTTPTRHTRTFRVRIRGGFYAPPDASGVWREIELRADQTLADLGEAIPPAFGFDDDHLWSFYLSGKPWDAGTEYARIPADDLVGLGAGPKRLASQLRAGEAPAGREFLFLFDYGDEWHFGVRLARTGEIAPGGAYPRVVASRGGAPPQYPDVEDDWDVTDDATEAALSVTTTRFPPVATPSLDDLRAAAASAPVVRGLRQLAEWAGAGRALTARGNLTIADGKDLAARIGLADPAAIAGARVGSARELAGLDLMIMWAKRLGLVRVHKGRLVRVKQGQRLLDDSLALFSRAFEELPRLGAELLRTGVIESAFPGGLAEAAVDLLSAMYAGEEPMAIAEVADHVWEEHVLDRLDEPDADDEQMERWRIITDIEVGQLVAALRGLGVIEPVGPDDEQPGAAEAEDADAAWRALAQVGLRLTPLGTWEANILLRALGADAPVIGDLADSSLATVIDGVADYDEAACRAELRAWCELRGGAAAGEAAAYARATSRIEHRMMAFTALEEAGPAAEAEVRAMVTGPADPTLRTFAQLWLVSQGFGDHGDLDPAATVLLLAETLATILAADGPASVVEHLERLGPPGEQVALLEDMWRAPSPRVEGVLEAIGATHPTARVAKAARRAAFKLRSQRGTG